MGYLSVLISLVAGATKGFIGKRISGKVQSVRDSVFVNLLRMSFCLLISLLLLPFDGKGGFSLDGSALLFGCVAGIFLCIFTITWLLAVQNGAFMLISVAQMFGVVVTLLCSFAVFREKVSLLQLVGIALLVAAVLVMGSYSKSIKGSLSLKALILLVLCGLSSGLYDFSQKLFTFYSESSISTLNLLTYGVSVVVLGGVMLFPRKQEEGGRVTLKSISLAILMMSVCLFLNSYFKALATKYLTATQIYPIYQAGGLILGALMSAAFFKERITPRCFLGLGLAFAAILFLR